MSAVWMWMAKNDGTCGRRQGGRAGARFSRPPEQPLAPEVASASPGHLGHAVGDLTSNDVRVANPEYARGSGPGRTGECYHE